MTDKSYSDETCRISKFTQNDVQNKDAVFITEIEMSVLKKQYQIKNDGIYVVAQALQEFFEILSSK